MAEGPKQELDVWKVKIIAPSTDMFVEDDLPPGFRSLPGEGTAVEALSWNYISVGVDAESAYRFHHLRNTKPYLASTRMLNQMWYGLCGVRAGWFCCPPAMKNTVTMQIMKADNTWVDLELPSSVKAIVLLNLQSYGGGRNIFGAKLGKKGKEKDFQKPAFNDGLIEVVGLGHGMHTALVIAKLTHAIRLAQCRAARLKIKAPERADGEPGRTFMQLDGEPWPQAVPSAKSDQPLVMEVSLEGKSLLVMNPKALKGEPSVAQDGMAASNGQAGSGHTESVATVNGHGGGATADIERAVELTALVEQQPTTQHDGETSENVGEVAKAELATEDEADTSKEGEQELKGAPIAEDDGAAEAEAPAYETEAHPAEEDSGQNEEIQGQAVKEEAKK